MQNIEKVLVRQGFMCNGGQVKACKWLLRLQGVRSIKPATIYMT